MTNNECKYLVSYIDLGGNHYDVVVEASSKYMADRVVKNHEGEDIEIESICEIG